LLRVLFLITAVLITASASAQSASIRPVSFTSQSQQEIFEHGIWEQRHDFLTGIENNILFLESARGNEAYQRVNGIAVDREQIHASLLRFRTLLLTSESSEDFRKSLRAEFKLYRSIGMDGSGTVKFTGYYQPLFKASKTATAEYRFPIYRIPDDFNQWQKPHPTRVTLEGYFGTGSDTSPIKGTEIAWLKNRFEAFMIHVQGSAILEYPDGSKSSIGYAAGTDYAFRGVPQEFLDYHQVGWGTLPSFFARKPQLLDPVLARNNRFIFFKELNSPDPIGSLGVPVMPERSIATDKSRLPPGAVGIIRATLPEKSASGEMQLKFSNRFVLDQDTGSAMRGPGRVDLFMGTGSEAEQKANMMYSSGELYYFLLNQAERV
jgi:membrane-bound lytic murein transglycosylase A